MRFRKKVLLAVLALTLTTTNSITKDISLLNKANVSFAAESSVKNDIELITPDSNYEYTTEHVKGILEVLKDELKVLLNNNFDEFNYDQNILDKLNLYKETYESLLNLEKDQSKTDELKYKDALIDLLLKKEKLKTGKAEIDEKLSPIISTLDDVKLESKDLEGENKVVVITINKGEDYKNYLVEKDEIKKEIPVYIKKIQDNFMYVKKEEEQQTNSELKIANELLTDPSASLDELKNSRDKLKTRSETLDDAYTNSFKKELITNISQLKEKLKEKLNNKDSKNYLSKKFYDTSIEKITNIEKDTQNANKETLEKYLQDLTLMEQNIEKIKEKVTDLGLSNLIKEIEKANSNKEIQAYYRASVAKRDSYAKVIDEANNYLQGVLESVSDSPDTFDPETYKAEETGKQIEKIGTSYNELDGLNYDDLLKKAKDKFETNKKNLSEESIKELQKQFDLLNDSKNKYYTVDDVNAFSKLIDGKVEADKTKLEPKSKPKEPAPKNDNVKVKKVEVPRAEDKGKKGAKSIVRTGIDSVKIFGVIAIVAAVVLIFLSKKKKDK